MAVETSLLETLSSFTTACDSATQALPDIDALLPPQNGISLLDAKNQIFLSYLQALALRNLSVIRALKDGATWEDTQKLHDEITNLLIEHRAYLERGVRPLQQKIKYQTDKVVKAADDEERAAVEKQKRAVVANARVNGKAEGSGEEDDDDEEDSEDDEDEEEVEQTSYRPNLAGFGKSTPASTEDRRSESKKDGVYRPPRVSATSMPTTEQRERKERRPQKSATLEEYVDQELSNAPVAQPSIGSTIAQGGRKTKDARQLAKEQERTDYEETHLMRLPKESKKELARQRAKDRRGGFGGEEWRDLGNAVDRIGELTKRKRKEGAIDKSRKRRATEDGPRGDGTDGGRFEVKQRRVMKKMKR